MGKGDGEVGSGEVWGGCMLVVRVSIVCGSSHHAPQVVFWMLDREKPFNYLLELKPWVCSDH